MKTLKIRLPEAVDAYTALGNFLSKNKFPFEFAWEIEDINETLEKHTTRYEEARNTILVECAEPTEEPGANGRQSFKVLKPEEFKSRMEELNKAEVEITFKPIQYNKLKSVPDLLINPQDLTVLKKYFIEKEASNDNKKGKRK